MTISHAGADLHDEGITPQRAVFVDSHFHGFLSWTDPVGLSSKKEVSPKANAPGETTSSKQDGSSSYLLKPLLY
jgi:hypothetical protein